MKTLVIQRGHVPRTTGATGTAGEQAMAIAVAGHIAASPRSGWTVRVIDADEPTSRYAGDAFVAIHGDGSTNRSAGGASVGYRNEAGRQLAQRWKAAYRQAGWPYSFRADNYTTNLSGYYGTRRAVTAGNHAAIIIEVGFLTNPTERQWIDANPNHIARSVWDAVAGDKEEEPVSYRIVTAECDSQGHRDTLARMCARLNMAHTVLGRCVVFHGHVDRIREVEAYVADNADSIKRTHGVIVEAGTHAPLNQAPPHGRFAEPFSTDSRYANLVAKLKELIA